ncbi:MAG TPA: hypothetical protein VL495_05280 [Edaphobacter sp.]|jgi:hypothetical protein|nr:hypothetical protein [Edaphobacter sp.]
MARTRSIFFHGLSIVLRRLPAFLWAYVFSLGLALVFSLPLYRQISRLLNHSLVAQRLSSGFDLATVLSTATRLHGNHTGEADAMTSHASVVVYLVIYFLLVPGTIFCYLTRSHARLSTLVVQGLLHFWRFVRITLLTLFVALILLGPLYELQRRWSDFVDDRFVGRTSLLLTLAGALVILLIASLLRLYFDLVEVYTVQLGTHSRASGRPDRRVRRTLGPALKLLRSHLLRAWLVFLLLAILGFITAFFTTRTAMHMLAQNRVWPMFFVAQLGLFVMLFTRFWQRGAETSLILQHPITPETEAALLREPYPYIRPTPPPPTIPVSASDDSPHHIETIFNADPINAIYPSPFSADDPLVPPESKPAVVPDPIPDPEPAVPSLDEPDPGVFHPHPPPASSDDNESEKH